MAKKRKMVFFVKLKKSKKVNRKKRETNIFFDMGKPVTFNKLSISKTGNIVLMKDDQEILPEKVFIETSYSRDNPKKQKKVLNKLPLDPQKIVASADKAFNKYYSIFAIDTNTEFINQNKISVCSIVLCKINPGDEYSIARFGLVKTIEYWNIQEKPELIALIDVIDMIISNPTFNRNWKIGIVIDTELDKLLKINNREIPIYYDCFLPEEIELIYASAEVGKEYLPNIMINQCDKEAKKILNEIKTSSTNTLNLVSYSDAPFTHRRIWKKKQDIQTGNK